jgi:hypothetical protein
MTDALCEGRTGLGIKKCPVASPDCDLWVADAPDRPLRTVRMVASAPVPSPFPRRVPGWCTSDNIMLAQGPRKLTP